MDSCFWLAQFKSCNPIWNVLLMIITIPSEERLYYFNIVLLRLLFFPFRSLNYHNRPSPSSLAVFPFPLIEDGTYFS